MIGNFAVKASRRFNVQDKTIIIDNQKNALTSKRHIFLTLLSSNLTLPKIKVMTAKQIVLASRPKGTPTADNFRFEDFELPGLEDGEVLLKGLYFSVDPYMRGRMNDTKSYSPPFQLNKAIEGGVVAKITKSKSASFKTGYKVAGMLPWRTQIIAGEKGLKKIDTTIAPASYYLGILGMTVLTAYFGLMHIGKPKAGETVVVPGAAGAV